MSTTTEEKRTTRQIIWGALVDLRAQQQIATRQVLAMARHVPSSVWQLGARAMGA